MRKKHIIRKIRLSYGERSRRRGVPPLPSFHPFFAIEFPEMPDFEPVSIVHVPNGLLAAPVQIAGGFRKGGAYD